MKRFGHGYDNQATVGETADGPYVLYEEAHDIETDRGIKAVNLKTLVDMVLEYADFAEQFVDGPPYDDAGKKADEMWTGVIALARGLKQ